MKQENRQTKLLQITALSAALMGVYGVAGAADDPHCTNTICDFTDINISGTSTVSDYEWVVKGTNAQVTIGGNSSVTALGNKIRAIGATSGSTVTLNGVEVITDTQGGTNWGSHGVQAHGDGSTLNMNGTSIDTTGTYSNGIQAEAKGTVIGTEVEITADGGSSYTFGVEAGDGGSVELTGGFIEVTGVNAAGVRAYSGFDGTKTSPVPRPNGRGNVVLDGTGVTVTGSGAIGLMAGDEDGDKPVSAGDILFKNADVAVTGASAQAARVIGGSVLQLRGDTQAVTLTATNNAVTGNATGVLVTGAGSEVEANNINIVSTAAKQAKGLVAEDGGKITVNGGTIKTIGGFNSHAIDAYQVGSLIIANNVDVETSGYAAGAFNGGEVVLDTGNYDVVATTPTLGWDSTSGFVVAGGPVGSKLSANNVRLTNSIPLANAGDSPTSYALRVGAGTALDDEMSLTESQVIASGEHRRIANLAKSASLVAIESLLVSEQEAGVVMGGGSSLTLSHSTLTANKEGIQAKSGSSLDVRDSTVTSATGHALDIEDSTATILDSTVVSNGGSGSRGILATGTSNVTVERTNITTTGESAHAIHAWGDSDLSTTPQIHLEDGQINTSGRESYGLSAQNSGEVSTFGTIISTSGEGGFGAFAYKEGVLDITGGSITTNGVTSFVHDPLGVDVGNYGVLAKNKSTATITGTTVITKGSYAEGLRSENDGADGDGWGSSSSITATNVNITTAGEEAHGVTAYGSDLIGEDSVNGSTLSFTGGSIRTGGENAAGALAVNGGAIELVNTTIITTGAEGHGVGAATETAPVAYASSVVSLNNVHIQTAGKEAFGLAAYNGDSEIEMTGGSITTTGQGSAGLFVGNGADITLNNVKVETSGPSILSRFGVIDEDDHVASDLIQNAEISGSSTLTKNDGTLLRVDRMAQGEDGVINLTLKSGSSASGNIRNYDSEGNLVKNNAALTNFVVESGALCGRVFSSILKPTLLMTLPAIWMISLPNPVKTCRLKVLAVLRRTSMARPISVALYRLARARVHRSMVPLRSAVT